MNEKRRACAPYQFFGAPWTASGTGQNAAHSGGSMCGPLRRVATLRDRWRSPTRLAQVVRGQSAWRRYLRGNAGSLRRLPGRQAERFGMGPAVVLGQDLTGGCRAGTRRSGGRSGNG
jgi:hypothetical protein